MGRVRRPGQSTERKIDGVVPVHPSQPGQRPDDRPVIESVEAPTREEEAARSLGPGRGFGALETAGLPVEDEGKDKSGQDDDRGRDNETGVLDELGTGSVGPQDGAEISRKNGHVPQYL